jgi:uncharacterized protein YbaP (TraB family)
MKRLIYSIVLLPLLLFSQNDKKYPALLWKISGNGLKKPSYLYGTMHVSNRVAYYLSEQFFDALKSADVVGLETNPGEWLDKMQETGELDEINRLSLNNTYNTDFYRSTFTVTFPEKRVFQGVLSYDPDIINGLLYRQNKSRENFEESTYIDLFIYQSAAKLNKQVISLESFAESEIKARLSTIPDEDPEGRNRNYYTGFQKIEDAYRDGDLDLLDSLSKLGNSKNTQRYLIDDRNVFFVNTIDSVLKIKSLFSGVGAAHLPGENGVIELLRKKGYTVEPLLPKVSKKSNSIREDLDTKIKPVTFTRQFINDSAFSVNLPGKMYPIVNLENIKYYIHPDMVNGSFYTIMRLRHLAPLFGLIADDIAKKVDSLLFENIPGKILLKKDIEVDGIKGIEIVNETRRGDEQHYQVFFTDLEMIMFKLGGKKRYASGNESKQFFNSIQFGVKSDKTITFSPKTKGFSVNVPSNYTYIKHEGSSMTGLVEELQAYHKIRKEFYVLKQAVYNDFNYLEEDTFELNQFAKNILQNYNYKQKQLFEITRHQGFPALKFKAKNEKGLYLSGLLVIKGVHYYFAHVISNNEVSFEHDFFKSFKLIDFESIHPLKEITDKDFYFKAIDEVTDNALSRFNESYTKAYNAAQSHVKQDSARNDYDFRTGNKFYYSPSSNEYVNITFEKYNDYDYRNSAEMNEKIEKILKSSTSMYLASKEYSYKDGYFKYHGVLKDTGTSRAVDLKIFMKNGLMHEISAPYDTTIGLRGWTKGFMDSFTPLDSVIGKNVFENKFDKLLNDLCSNDTVVRRMANRSISSIGMQKAFGEQFVKFVSGDKLPLVNEDSRAQLFVNGGTLENEKIIAPYKNLYKQYTDSFYLQLCVLKGLAYLKTQNSYDALYSLVMEETPLVGAENTVNDVFGVLHDSLELCKKFFPGMLVLAKYDEYREAVYTLLGDLVSKKIISPSAYAAQKESILVDATLELKRYNPSTAKTQSYDEPVNFDYLEKASKELAESIKGSLDGLSNNNLYKGTDYLRDLDRYNRHVLVSYAYVLSPFYKTDEKTKQFFTKLSKIKTQNIAMPVTINLLKHDIVLNDTLVSFYSKNKFTRAFFYSELEKEKLTEKFDQNYLSQKSLIESVLMSQRQLNSFYNYEKDKSKKDSLTLIKIKEAGNRYQKGKIYIYKNIRNKNEDEQWSAVFVNDSKDPITSRIEVVNTTYYIDTRKTEEENINELLNYFSLGFRKRAQVNNQYD